MTTQVKLLKSLSLVVVAALVIILAPALSGIAEEITLTTIMPSQDVLKLKKGVVGNTYKGIPSNNITDDELYIEGKVGIGTTAPSELLEIRKDQDAFTRFSVNNTNDGGGTTVAFKEGADRRAFISYNNTANLLNVNAEETGSQLSFNTAGVEKMRIDATGNVGIGTTAPGAKLHVVGEEGVDGIMFPDGTLQTSAGGAPPGAMMVWTTDTAPAGWLLCYGQAVSRTGTYAALFAVIGTVFGAGDGSATFNLPDMRGRFPLGQDDMGGVDAGRVNQSAAKVIGRTAGIYNFKLKDFHLPSHTHYVPDMLAISGGVTSGGVDFWTRDTADKTTSSTGGDQPHNNMPPYMTFNYIIKC